MVCADRKKTKRWHHAINSSNRKKIKVMEEFELRIYDLRMLELIMQYCNLPDSPMKFSYPAWWVCRKKSQIMKRVYIIKDDAGELKIITLEDQNDQTIFELEYAERILHKGDSIQDVIIQFSKMLEANQEIKWQQPGKTRLPSKRVITLSFSLQN